MNTSEPLVMSPFDLATPFTSSLCSGVAVPTPVFPEEFTTKAFDPTFNKDEKRFVELAVVENSDVVVALVVVERVMRSKIFAPVNRFDVYVLGIVDDPLMYELTRASV